MKTRIQEMLKALKVAELIKGVVKTERSSENGVLGSPYTSAPVYAEYKPVYMGCVSHSSRSLGG